MRFLFLLWTEFLFSFAVPAGELRFADVSVLNAHFGAAGANNLMFPELWVKQAAIFIPQLKELCKYLSIGSMAVEGVVEFVGGDVRTIQGIALRNKFEHFGSDKAQKRYQFIYSHIFDKLGYFENAPINVLEIGIGTNKPGLISTSGIHANPGAGLRAFENYAPYAKIFGADIDKGVLFNTPRIHTAWADQLNYSTLEALCTRFETKRFSLVIDAGIHSIGGSMNVLIFGLRHISRPGYIVIESISHDESGLLQLDSFEVIDFMMRSKAKELNIVTHMVQTFNGGYVYIVEALK